MLCVVCVRCSYACFMIFIEKVCAYDDLDKEIEKYNTTKEMDDAWAPTHATRTAHKATALSYTIFKIVQVHTHVLKLSQQMTHVDRRHDSRVVCGAFSTKCLEPFETLAGLRSVRHGISLTCLAVSFNFSPLDTSRWPDTLKPTTSMAMATATGETRKNKNEPNESKKKRREKNANNIMKHQILFYVSIPFL